jgi:hypothetical protein
MASCPPGRPAGRWPGIRRRFSGRLRRRRRDRGGSRGPRSGRSGCGERAGIEVVVTPGRRPLAGGGAGTSGRPHLRPQPAGPGSGGAGGHRAGRRSARCGRARPPVPPAIRTWTARRWRSAGGGRQMSSGQRRLPAPARWPCISAPAACPSGTWPRCRASARSVSPGSPPGPARRRGAGQGRQLLSVTALGAGRGTGRGTAALIALCVPCILGVQTGH